MQHSHSSTFPFEAQSGLWRILKYLLPAGVAILAIMEGNPTLLILPAIALGLILAIPQRLEDLDRRAPTDSQATPERLLGDGGCFPCELPEIEKPPVTPPRVLDGGSLEHHRR